MTRPEQLVAKIRRIEEQMATSRRDLAEKRWATVNELRELVGATEAARLLGITPAAIWKAKYKAR